MMRSMSLRVGLGVVVLGLSVLLAGCRGESPAPVETAPGAVVGTIALAVEGMT